METIPPAASDCLGVRARSVFRRRSIDAYISKETQVTMETIPPDCLGLVFEYAQFFLRCAISANRRNPVPSILGAHRRRVFAWRCGQRCSRTAGRSSECMCVEACHQDYLQAAVAFLVGNLHLSNLSIRQKASRRGARHKLPSWTAYLRHRYWCDRCDQNNHCHHLAVV